jgi:hypothetical protein
MPSFFLRAQENQMKPLRMAVAALIVMALAPLAAPAADAGQRSAPTANITIYNQNFAVVRQPISLDLRAGVNNIQFAGVTAYLEPDSVMLRDPLGLRQFQIYEQSFRNDPVSQELLLSVYEGKTITFRTPDGKLVEGKIIRSGYVPRILDARNPYGAQYAPAQPIIEVDGHLQFGLPGQPLFPALAADTVLKPTLNWQVATDKPGALEAELSYVSGGLRWEADYNVVAPEHGDALDLIGWVTMDNLSGKTFDNACVRLLAGDVNKIMPDMLRMGASKMAVNAAAEAMQPAVTERAFDEYHLYTLERPVTLRDHETKQVEFVSAAGVHSRRLYVYDGASINWGRYSGWALENIRNDPSYGTQSNPKVWVMQEIRNSAANHLGIALPAGRMRFYRRDEEGRLQFTGENMIDHTPSDETIRLYTGNAFDLTGERRRVDYRVDSSRNTMDESFEIKVRNHKKEPVEVRVVEHLYRWSNWQIAVKSHPYHKMSSNQAEFPVTVPPDGQVTITYTAHYWW